SPQLIEIIGYAGFDVVLFDLEHGEYTVGELPGLLRAAEIAGLHTVVRVANHDAATIGKALDFGADAVLVPHIESAEDAAAVVSAAKYPPMGTRGAYPLMRATAYGSAHGPGW